MSSDQFTEKGLRNQLIRIYVDRIEEKIGRLVSEIMVYSLTLFWLEREAI
jgi:hypothetical protein